MSRLNELISQYCPDGVEYKRLNEISEMKRGTSVTKKDVREGDIPVISGGREPAYYCDIFNRDGETITVAGSGAGAGYVQYWTIPIFVCDAFSIKGHECIQTKYLYYCLANMQEYIYSTKKGGGVPHVHISSIENVNIPVPPLPVQSEIVRILDNFTEFTENLTANLSAELTVRKQQYEFYREQLLTDNGNIPMLPLRSVVKQSCSGSTPAKSNSAFYEGGAIPWIRTQDVKFNEIYSVEGRITEEAVQKTAVKWIPENCVIVAISGATAGRCAVNKIKATTNQHCLNLEIDPQIALYRYVYHCICYKYQELLSKKQGARGDLNSSLILDTQIPVPSLEDQQRIVHILDGFDSLCTDLSCGLLAEIEARQKQYEYYRDKLLSFEAVGR